MTIPKISIVIPVCNTQTHLRRCLDSAAKQSLPDIEIIVVDDGSVDNSNPIIREYTANDNRFTLIEKSENQGTHLARLSGVRSAKGEYILFLDSDDEIVPHACKRAYTIVQNARADILHFQIDVRSRRAGDATWFRRHGAPLAPELAGASVFKQWLEAKRSGNVCGKLFRRTLFSQMDTDAISLQNMVVAEDFYLCFYLFSRARSYLGSSEALYIYHYGEGISSRSITSIAQWRRVLSLLIALEGVNEIFNRGDWEEHYRTALDDLLITQVRYLLDAWRLQCTRDIRPLALEELLQYQGSIRRHIALAWTELFNGIVVDGRIGLLRQVFSFLKQLLKQRKYCSSSSLVPIQVKKN